MIVIMSLLDDIPIMTIAYDNTPVSKRPIRWKMPLMLSISAVLGFFAVVQSFGLLLIGIKALSDPSLQLFGLDGRSQLQTVMFLQLVAGGHLLLFVTRTERWFFLPPFPAAPLFFAIVATQILAVLMCAFGWLVPPISWAAIGGVWLYNLFWMFILSGARLATEQLVENRTIKRLRSAEIVTKVLHPHGTIGAVRVRAES